MAAIHLYALCSPTSPWRPSLFSIDLWSVSTRVDANMLLYISRSRNQWEGEMLPVQDSNEPIMKSLVFFTAIIHQTELWIVNNTFLTRMFLTEAEFFFERSPLLLFFNTAVICSICSRQSNISNVPSTQRYQLPVCPYRVCVCTRAWSTLFACAYSSSTHLSRVTFMSQVH